MVRRDAISHNAAVHYGKVRGMDGIHRDVVDAEVGGGAGGAVGGTAVVGAAVRRRKNAKDRKCQAFIKKEGLTGVELEKVGDDFGFGRVGRKAQELQGLRTAGR